MKSVHITLRAIILIVLLLFTCSNIPAKSDGPYRSGSGSAPGAETQQDKITVSGVVFDESHKGMPGVNIQEKGGMAATVTDINGKYSLKVSKTTKTLVYSFIGYLAKEVDIKGQTLPDVSMEPDIAILNEVVVVGYGTQKKASVSGSVASVKGVEIVKSPSLNITNSIAGRVSGLVAVGQSGEPGEDYSTLYIRGQSTLNDNSPLIVIDGVPNRSLERIDPETIESISVLKDASAAIYGSQAANGVILVTTKRGTADQLEFSANYNIGFTRPTRIPALCNAYEYATLVNEVDYYDKVSQTYSASDLEKYADGSDLWRYPNTDWFSEVLKPWSMQQNANLTMSGGSEKVQSFVSLSTRNQDGFFSNSASKYAQQDLRTNFDFKLAKNIKFSLDATIRHEQREGPTASSSAIFKDLMTALPIQVARWPNGLPGPPLDPTTQNNPVVQATPGAGVSRGDDYVLNFNGKLTFRIPWIEGLTWTNTGAIDKDLSFNKYFSRKYALYKWDKVTLDDDNNPYLVSAQYGVSNLREQFNNGGSYLLNTILDFTRTFKDIHAVNVVAGAEMTENNFAWFAAERRNFANNFPEELDFGDPNQQYANGSNPGVNRWLNYFGRFNYTFKDKYIAEFVWRYQGSSKFAPETRWGFFPGLSIGYRISQESFWTNSGLKNIINTLKIRGSWGKTGNDLIDPYQFYSLYDRYFMAFVTGDQVYHQVYRESLAGNTKAQWEEADQINLGIDMSFLKSKLTLTADFFNNLRSKILITQTASVPTSTGLAYILPDINLGKVRNRGIDFEIAYNDQVGKIGYHVGLNGCYAKNKVLFFDEASGFSAWQKQTGYPMYSGLYYEAIGIYQTTEDLDKYPHPDEARTGDIIFRDVNNDGQITGEDMKRIHNNSVPTLTGGINLSLNYRGFDLSLMIQGQAGAVRYLQDLGGKGISNYLKSFYDSRWTESNPYTSYPRTFNRNDEYWVSSVNPNTYWLRRTDFIRLKNIEVGYTIPSAITRKIGINNLRVYVGGMNLFTISPDIRDYDPELEPKGDGFAGEGYPLQMIINSGVSIKF